MSDKQIDFNNKDQIIYIPAYVEQGTEILKSANDILEDIAAGIGKGLAKIEGSGYNRGIPYIEKGGEVSTAISSMRETITVITKELNNYSRGKNILPDDAIIIADEDTAKKYKIDKDKIYCSIAEYNEMPRVNPRWATNYLTASAGSNTYYAKDGRCTRETWCDLDPSNLANLMRKQGIDLDFWIREDGVYMYGDYVMVAADIPHMGGARQEAEYRKGDLVETSLGTGMVVDLCGMAENVSKGVYRGGSQYGDIDVWYDIYTAWHVDGMYHDVGYHDPTNSSGRGVKTLISEGKTRSSLYNSQTPLQTTSTLLTASSLIQDQTSPQVSELVNSPTTNTKTSSQTSTNLKLTQAANYQPSFTPSYSNNGNNHYESASNNNNQSNTTSHQSTIPTPTPKTGLTLLNKDSSLTNQGSHTVNLGTQNTTPIVQQATQNQNIQVPTYTEVNTHSLASSITEVNTPSPQQVPNSSLNNLNTQDNTYVIPTIPSSPEPVKTTKAVNAIPILVSLGLATAAGVSSKVYLDNKNNNQSTKEEESSIDDNDDLEDYTDHGIVTDEWIDSNDE